MPLVEIKIRRFFITDNGMSVVPEIRIVVDEETLMSNATRPVDWEKLLHVADAQVKGFPATLRPMTVAEVEDFRGEDEAEDEDED